MPVRSLSIASNQMQRAPFEEGMRGFSLSKKLVGLFKKIIYNFKGDAYFPAAEKISALKIPLSGLDHKKLQAQLLTLKKAFDDIRGVRGAHNDYDHHYLQIASFLRDYPEVACFAGLENDLINLINGNRKEEMLNLHQLAVKKSRVGIQEMLNSGRIKSPLHAHVKAKLAQNAFQEIQKLAQEETRNLIRDLVPVALRVEKLLSHVKLDRLTLEIPEEDFPMENTPFSLKQKVILKVQYVFYSFLSAVTFRFTDYFTNEKYAVGFQLGFSEPLKNFFVFPADDRDEVTTSKSIEVDDFDIVNADATIPTETFTSVPRSIRRMVSGKALVNGSLSTYIELLKKHHGSKALFLDDLVRNDPVNFNEILGKILSMVNEGLKEKKKFVFIPFIHSSFSKDHNVLLTIDLTNKKLEFYDPKGNFQLRRTIPGLGITVKNFLKEIENALPQEQGFQREVNHIRNQSRFDSKNCGMFVLKFIEARLSGLDFVGAAQKMEKQPPILGRLNLANQLLNPPSRHEELQPLLKRMLDVLYQGKTLPSDSENARLVIMEIYQDYFNELPKDLKILMLNLLGREEIAPHKVRDLEVNRLVRGIKAKIADPHAAVDANDNLKEEDVQFSEDDIKRLREKHPKIDLNNHVLWLKRNGLVREEK